MTRPESDVSYPEIQQAAERLAGVANRTPVMTSRTLNERVGASVFLKCENFQRVGAFKFRGAYNAMSRLSGNSGGVLAYSSGNHAQAVALAGRLLKIPTTIIMPGDAPLVKLEATKAYGAEVISYDSALASREEIGKRIAQERGLTLIPPFDHPDVVAGQGTAAKEMIEEVGSIDLVVAPCGGGGLLSGTAIAAKALSPGCRAIGVEPERGDDATRSFHSKTLCSVHNPDTVADGARTNSLGRLTFPLVLKYVDDMVTVSEDAILDAMFFLWERLKLVVEPTGAMAVAGLMSGVVEAPGKRIGIIVSGGNVDLAQVAKWRESRQVP